MTEAKIIPSVAVVTTSITIQLVVILAFNSISAQPPHALTTIAALWEFRGESRGVQEVPLKILF